MCIENLRRGNHLTPLEVTEMVLTLFCFLKDSADMSQVLLDDFKSSQGYQFFVEVLLRFVFYCIISSGEIFSDLKSYLYTDWKLTQAVKVKKQSEI